MINYGSSEVLIWLSGKVASALEDENNLQSARRLVYASTKMNGTQPYWPNSIFRVYIKPAAKKMGLTKRIGWHKFRHTFGTILNANGENPKVIQELLRHANLRVTMDTYVQAMSDEKRKAQSKVVEMIMPGIRKAAR